MEQLSKSLKVINFKSVLVFSLLVFSVVLAIRGYKELTSDNSETLGIADTTHTWDFLSATAGDYTYDTDLITVDNSGARPSSTSNKFANPGFEANITSWEASVTPGGVSDLEVWLKADAITGLNNNDPISLWLDSSTNGFDASHTDVNRYPVYQTNVTNSLPGIYFAGGDSSTADSLYILEISAPNPSPGNETTMFFVVKPSSSTPIGLLDTAPSTAGTLRNYNNGAWEWWGLSQVSLSLANADPVLLGLTTTQDGSSRTLRYYRNGQSISSATGAPNSIVWGFDQSWPVTLGNINRGSNGAYTGHLMEYILFSKVLTTAERDNVSYYLSQKYNLPNFVTPSYTFAYDSVNTYLTTSGALQVVADSTPVVVSQSINLGDTDQYELSAFVKKFDNSAVTSADVEIYLGAEAVASQYVSVGSNWWKVSADITGAASLKDYGLEVKLDKSVYIDEVTLKKDVSHELYVTGSYSNAEVVFWEAMSSTQSAAASSSIRYQLCDDDGSVCESGSSWLYWDGDSWETALNSTTHTNLIADFDSDAMNIFPIATTKIAVKVIFNFDGVGQPLINDLSVGLVTDSVPPTTNASATEMSVTNGGRAISPSGWANNPAPFFSWTAGADNPGGSGIKGYCLYLGQDPAGNPANSKGLLGSSPVSTTGTTCGFIVSTTEIDLATLAFRGDPWMVTDTLPYYLNVKAVDNAGLVFQGASEQFEFYYDETLPLNVAFINPASGNFNSVTDMNFSWPINGGSSSSDVGSGVLGWQYAINGTTTWLGPDSEVDLGIDYLPVGYTLPHFLQTDPDAPYINLGDNVIYFRTVDQAGNTSLPSTYRTGNLSYGGSAPAFGGDAVVTIDPASNTENNFAISWPDAIPADGRTIDTYYYMINTSPPATLATMTSNSATYRPSESTTVPTQLLVGAQKGSNVVNVVAVDDEGNYSPSNSITGSFTLDSSYPDPATNLTVSDASIKAISLWRAALAWDEPVYQGTGTLTYVIQRSLDGAVWEDIAVTGGLSYVDTVTVSQQYYWRVGTRDTTDESIASPSLTNAVALTPKGSYTSPPELTSQPVASSIGTRKAKITWTTNRVADSKIAYSTISGEYEPVEPSNSAMVTEHIIDLTSLTPGTTYYYIAKWTDEDGNTGQSTEKQFSTAPAPTVTNPFALQIGLNSVILQYTVNGASSVKIYYGKTPSFGGIKEVPTSPVETTYTTELSGLDDGTEYYYKINTLDSEGFEYQGTTLLFSTLPRPRITNVRLQQVANRSQSTVLVSWDSNTPISSIITYYPSDAIEEAKDQVEVELLSGEHQMILSGLEPSRTYSLVVSGIDKAGNRAESDIQTFRTSDDTRPPEISGMRVVGSLTSQSGSGDNIAQLIVSWNTDEPATSQVEFGEGTGTAYSQTTQEDGDLSQNHTVVISGLTPSKIYHVRAISSDIAENESRSVDIVTVAPKSNKSALELVLGGLSEIFSFILPEE